MAKVQYIVGPPGTGKTTQIAHAVGQAVEKYGADRVIAVSFTRAAAAELAGRNLPIPQHHVGTLHAMAYRALGAPTIADTPDGCRAWNDYCDAENQPRFKFGKAAAVQAAATDPDESLAATIWDQESGSLGDRLMSRYQIQRAMKTRWQDWPAPVVEFSQLWGQYKREQGSIDFTDVIEQAIAQGTRLPDGPAVIFADEVQDFTPLELALLRHWADQPGVEHLVMAGDPDQAIYGFKGADPEVFLRETPDHRTDLQQSVRVPRAVHAWAEQWISQIEYRLQRQYRPRPVEGELVTPERKASYRDTEQILAQVKADLAQKNDQGKPQTVMLLASCAYMLDDLKHAMRQEGLPFHNPYRRKRGDWNPLHGNGRGVSALERVLAFLRPDGPVFGEQARMWNGDDLTHWLEPLEAKGILRYGGKAKIKKLPPGAEVGFDQLLEIFEESALGPATGLDLNWYDQHLLDTRRKALEYPARVAQRQGGQALREQPRICLGTIHSVKGAQADVVYLFPDLSNAGQDEWDGKLGEAAKDGVRRIFFTGATRARGKLVLCTAATGLAVDWAV